MSDELQLARIKNQLFFIEDMLQEAARDPPTWLLVVGHYPVFSRGQHGDTDELVQYLQPLLVQYGVQAYICGHDHISEHLSADGIEYFVSGAGSMTDSLGKEDSYAQLQWSGVGYSAFSAFDATLESLKVSYIDYTGAVKYEYALQKGASNLSRQAVMMSANLSSDSIDSEHVTVHFFSFDFNESEVMMIAVVLTCLVVSFVAYLSVSLATNDRIEAPVTTYPSRSRKSDTFTSVSSIAGVTPGTVYRANTRDTDAGSLVSTQAHLTPAAATFTSLHRRIDSSNIDALSVSV